MASARVHFSVGLFMTVGMGLATLLIIWLGMSSLLHEGELFVTYFDESVQGLNVDSPVKYRGVPVGRVKDVRIAPDYRLIEVIIVIESTSALDKNFADSVARLANVGITGAMFVDIDKATPGTEYMSPGLSFEPEYPVIASRPSNIKKLFREIEDIAAKIHAIDFPGISRQALSAFETLHTSIQDAQIGAIATDIRTLLASINTAANPQRLESIARNTEQTVVASRTMVTKAAADVAQIGALASELRDMIAANRPHVDTAVSALATTAVKADAVMTQSHATMIQMQTAIKNIQEQTAATAVNLEQTSANLNALISTLKDQPSQLIFAAPKPPRPLEE